MLLLLVLACSGTEGTWARAVQIETLDQTIGGQKAMARPGDFLLENDQVRVAILDARYSLGPSPYGGTLADADLQRSDPRYAGGHGNDQLAELFGTVNMNLVGADEPGDVVIAADGADGEARVHVQATGEPFLSMLGALWGLVGQPEFVIGTDYVLDPGARAVRIETTASLDGVPDTIQDAPGAADALPVLELAMQTGLTFGDFYLQGGSVDVFAPGIGFDEDRAVYDAAVDGRNLFSDPFKFEFVGGTADGISYVIAAADGDLYVPLFTSSQTAVFGAGVVGELTFEGDTGAGDDRYDRFPDGQAWRYTRYLGVGKGDIGSALSAIYATRGDAVGSVGGHVVEAGSATPLSKVNVLVMRAGEDAPFSQFLTDVGDDTQIDGSFGGEADGLLPPGDYDLVVHQSGRPDSAPVRVTIAEGQHTEVLLAGNRTGAVTVHVVDELGRSVPSKVTFFSTDGAKVLNPTYGDHYIGGDPAEVVFAPYGEAEAVLPPGGYYAIATRGLEYEIATSDDFTVSADGVAELNLQIVHSVDSDGWISADFHVHGANSFDSGVSLENRVITFASEGVDFFSSSDHDYLTDYQPTVEALGLEPWVKTAVGLETTTLEIGHFLGFPMQQDHVKDQGGAFDWTGMPPEDILDELEDLGIAAGYDPFRFVAHPRDGILGYFDQFGFDVYTGEVETPLLSRTNEVLKNADNFTTDFEGLELLNGKRFELIRTPTQPEMDSYANSGELTSYQMVERTAQEQEDLIDGVYRLAYGTEGQVDDWFTLLNKGVRLTALGNSDTHSRFSIEAGCPRNLVYVGEDDPAALDAQQVADAVRAGHVVASYGPLIRFTANDGEAIVGDEIEASGSVKLHIEVEAPSWMDVNRVELYQNGTLIHEWTGLDPDVLRFAQDYEAPVTKDSWFVVIAMGDGDLSPLFSPVEFPPIQLQDVVIEALSDVPAVGSFLSPATPIPRTGAVLPYALTNPIYVNVDGGDWTPPGLQSWLKPPIEPE